MFGVLFRMIIGSIYYISKDFGTWNRKYIRYLLLRHHCRDQYQLFGTCPRKQQFDFCLFSVE